MHLTGLRRKIAPIIAAESDAMPITVNVRDNTLELWAERVLSEATLERVLGY